MKRQNNQSKIKADASIDQNSIPRAVISSPIPILFGERKIKNMNIIVDGGFNSEVKSRTESTGGGSK
ncbi:hypothetical protein [Candidatus Francisella endociliophora]|nr:hypothetical protein [Francisella sp. FSC1006]